MKTALVTGANKGIGLEIARQLAVHGFHVLLGARRADAGRKAAEALAESGGKVSFLRIDVSDPESVLAAARTFAADHEQLDVLVNNAGVVLADRDSGILNMGEDVLRETMETNTFGPLRVTRTFRQFLEKSEAPRVINVSSSGGQLTDGADGWAPAYCISKTALNGVTAQLAAALPEFAVNAVCPGWVATEMGGPSAPRTVEEGADSIVWLATEAPQSLTGQFIKDRQPIPW